MDSYTQLNVHPIPTYILHIVAEVEIASVIYVVN